MKRYVLLVLACCACLFVAAQSAEVSGKVASDKVQVGRPFDFDLQLKVPYGCHVEWNDFEGGALSEQVEILKRGPVERTADADSNVIVNQTLTLMTFDTGYVQIPAVTLVYAKSFGDPMRLQAITDPIDLYVTTIAADTTQSFRPIIEPIAAPFQAKDLYPWLVALLLLALLGLCLWQYLKRRRRQVDANGNVISGPVVPPYEKAIGGLESLRQQKLWQAGKTKEYYSAMTDIAREYLEGQFDINAVEMTTDSILEEVKPLGFSRESYAKLKDVMELADLVKFAKYAATNLENDVAMNNMTDFVNESYAHFQDLKAQEALQSPEVEAKGKEGSEHV